MSPNKRLTQVEEVDRWLFLLVYTVWMWGRRPRWGGRGRGVVRTTETVAGVDLGRPQCHVYAPGVDAFAFGLAWPARLLARVIAP